MFYVFTSRSGSEYDDLPPMCTNKCRYWKIPKFIYNRLNQLQYRIIFTVSSLWISINAKNSNNRNLWVAIALPSHAACAGGWPASISPDIAVDVLPLEYGCCENGLMLKVKRKWRRKIISLKFKINNTDLFVNLLYLLLRRSWLKSRLP